MSRKPKFRAIGWIGFSEDKPFFESVRDAYSDGLVQRAELFKSFKAAHQRFEHVERVEIGPRRKARKGKRSN